MNSQFKDKIFIGNHNIDCTGAIRESRYRETKTNRFDGIHLIGSSGKKAYTKSVLNILKTAKLTASEYDFHQSCPQYQYSYQERQNRNRNSNQNSYRQRNDYNKRQAGHKNPQNEQGRFTVPTANRFSSLAGLNHLNY